MSKFLKARNKNDRGDASVISLLVALPIVLGILFTIIDVGIYFMNSQTITSAARDAARTVAIYGGNGTKDMVTTIESAYGAKNTCINDSTVYVNQNGASESKKVSDFTKNQTSTECGLANLLVTSPMLIGAQIKPNGISCDNILGSNGDIKTDQKVTDAIGANIICKVEWEYSGIPGSTMGFIKSPKKDAAGNVIKDQKGNILYNPSPLASNTSVGIAQSEVKLSEDDLTIKLSEDDLTRK